MYTIYLGLLSAATMAVASIVHYGADLPAPAADSTDRARVYAEQNTKLPFYSYGYSGKTSARAEYTSADGYAKGFYSYIDANGELQTVRYIAGKEEGFKAAATNLPVSEGDSLKPVTDTPEVKQAKLEHFQTFREAERRDQLLKQAEYTLPYGYNIQEDEQQQQQQQENASADNREDVSSSSEYRYIEAEESSDGADGGNNNALYDGHGGHEQTVRIPIHAYYTLVAPTTRYSVLTPTVLQTIPLPSGDSGKLPISISTSFVSQRLK